MAGSAIAKISSSIGSFESGWVSGSSFSNPSNSTDIRIVAYVVLMAKLLPRKIKPTARSTRFTIVENILAESGVILANTTAAPVTPPNVKLFGN